MSVERANLLLDAFGNIIGLAGLMLDERGYACLTFDDLAVNIEHEPVRDSLVLFAWLGEAARAGPELLAELLEATLRAHATGEPVFGYERAGDGVVLLDRLALDGLDVTTFQARLETFLATADRWRRRLSRATPARSEGDDRLLTQFMRV